MLHIAYCGFGTLALSIPMGKMKRGGLCRNLLSECRILALTGRRSYKEINDMGADLANFCSLKEAPGRHRDGHSLMPWAYGWYELWAQSTCISLWQVIVLVRHNSSHIFSQSREPDDQDRVSYHIIAVTQLVYHKKYSLLENCDVGCVPLHWHHIISVLASQIFGD